MPELPEVETTCRSIAEYVVQQRIVKVVIRQKQLRWGICTNLSKLLTGHTIQSISRRAKYILVTCTKGTLIIHLGMTGKLSIVSTNTLVGKHDHVDILLENSKVIRYTDPRRFGSIHWTANEPYQHKLLINLGLEPLSREFAGQYLFVKAKNRKVPIKSFLMDPSVVVGIGNIYANEALFLARLRPMRTVNTISLQEYNHLVTQIKVILKKAIKKGGTTIKDYLNANGKPGYFYQNLMVYGRKGECCYQCNTILQAIRLNQRSTVFCPVCQR